MNPNFHREPRIEEVGEEPAISSSPEAIAELEANKAFKADSQLVTQCKYRPFYSSALGSKNFFKARNGLLVDVGLYLEVLSLEMQRTMDYHCKQEKRQTIDGTWRVSASSFRSFINEASTDPIEIKGYKILRSLESESEKLRRDKDVKAIDEETTVGTANRRQAERERERVNPDLKKEEATKAFEQFIKETQPGIDRQKEAQEKEAQARKFDEDVSSARRNALQPTQSDESLAVLGLNQGATTGEIRAAYRRLASVHHPDKHKNDTPEVKQVNHDQMVKLNLVKQEFGI